MRLFCPTISTKYIQCWSMQWSNETHKGRKATYQFSKDGDFKLPPKPVLVMVNLPLVIPRQQLPNPLFRLLPFGWLFKRLCSCYYSHLALAWWKCKTVDTLPCLFPLPPNFCLFPELHWEASLGWCTFKRLQHLKTNLSPSYNLHIIHNNILLKTKTKTILCMFEFWFWFEDFRFCCC